MASTASRRNWRATPARFNDQSTNTEVEVEVDDSFTSEVDAAFDNSLEWENSGNIFSPGAATTGGEAETEFDF